MIHQEVAESLNNFFDAQEKCVEMLKSKFGLLNITMADWPEFTNSQRSQIERAILALEDLEIKPGDDARTTRFYPGVIEADEETLDCFCSLNESKDLFKLSMQKLKSESPKEHRLFNEFVRSGKLDSREERYGRTFGPISINHVYRKLSILKRRPESISYSWSCRSSSMIIVTKKEAVQALEGLNSDLPVHLQIQLNNLARIPDTEQLVKMIPSPAGAKVNICYRDGDRSTIKPALPIIIPAGDSQVRLKFLSEEDVRRKSSRLRRADKKIEESPIAPSIHLYRYKEGYRANR